MSLVRGNANAAPPRTPRLGARVGAAFPLVLAIATAAWTLFAPASLPRAERQPPRPLPARLDPGFLTDLATLRPLLPQTSVVAVEPGSARRRIASWYWTMAAFTAPEARFTLAGRNGAEIAADWLLRPASGGAQDGWRLEGCATEWCLWRR